MPLVRSPTAPTRRTHTRLAEARTPLVRDFVSSVSLVLWLAPNTAVADGNFVWPDAGLGVNNFVAARDAPTITADWLDGNDGVTFDGTLKQVLRCGAFTGVGKTSKPVALLVASINSDHPAGSPTLLYVAGKNSLLQASYQVLNISVSSSAGFIAKSVLGSGGTASQASASAAGGYANGAPHLFMVVAANASDRAEVWEANTLRGTAAAGASGGLYVTPTHAVIGSGDEGGGATRWFDGTIGDVMVFSGAPTASELTALYAGYFRYQWPTVYAGLSL